MKRADLKVGESYAAGRVRDWRDYPSSLVKVTVLDAGEWTDDDNYHWSHRNRPARQFTLESGDIGESKTADRKGSRDKATHVWVRAEKFGKEVIETIPLTQIKAPWSEVQAFIAERKARAAADEAAKREQMRESRAKDGSAMVILQTLVEHGVDLPTEFLRDRRDYEDEVKFSLSRAELACLLESAYVTGRRNA